MADPLPYSREDKSVQPPLKHDEFRASVVRAPTQPLVRIPHTLTEITGPSGDGVWEKLMGPAVADLTRQHKGEPIGERIVVSGRVLDENDRPVPNVMIEILQANASGRYVHEYDQHDAPRDPNFTGAGRVITDAEGRYRFVTIRPGAYPWYNGWNSWRPASRARTASTPTTSASWPSAAPRSAWRGGWRRPWRTGRSARGTKWCCR